MRSTSLKVLDTRLHGGEGFCIQKTYTHDGTCIGLQEVDVSVNDAFFLIAELVYMLQDNERETHHGIQNNMSTVSRT
jgi:hypothetical protein